MFVLRSGSARQPSLILGPPKAGRLSEPTDVTYTEADPDFAGPALKNLGRSLFMKNSTKLRIS